MTDIAWTPPWRPILLPSEIASVRRQLEREIGPGHPLHGRGLEPLGRRFDNDDVVAIAGDGTYVKVKLTWSSTGRPAGDGPTWLDYGDLREFLSAMRADDDELEP